MSFQAYLDSVEEKTGKTPDDFIPRPRKGTHAVQGDHGLAQERLWAWHGPCSGHRSRDPQGSKINVRQTTCTHRDESDTLRLSGKKR